MEFSLIFFSFLEQNSVIILLFHLYLTSVSILSSMNLNVHGFTFALLILLLLSISILWSMISSTFSVAVTKVEFRFLYFCSKVSYFCLYDITSTSSSILLDNVLRNWKKLKLSFVQIMNVIKFTFSKGISGIQLVEFSSSIPLCCIPLSLRSLEGAGGIEFGLVGLFGLLIVLLMSSSGQILFENILKKCYTAKANIEEIFVIYF